MASSSSSTTQHLHAAAAAGARALECRERLDELRSSGFRVDPDDVARARDRLHAARTRAGAAQERLELLREARADRRARTLLFGIPPCRLPAYIRDGEPGGAASRLYAAVSMRACSALDLWLEFTSYGGEVALWEFDAYLNGAWEMSERDRVVLEQVWSERERLG